MAGIYSQNGQDSLHAYHVCSYIPTLGSLINARSKYTPPSRLFSKVLLAAVSRPPKWDPLPFADEELNVLRSIIPTSAIEEATSTDGGRGAATCNDILAIASDACILHLACHGYQNRDNVLESGFMMQDRQLTVSRLMTLNLPKAFFAFLSACSTASGDIKQPNQAVNLASTMLFTGFKSVVATMW